MNANYPLMQLLLYHIVSFQPWNSLFAEPSACLSWPQWLMLRKVPRCEGSSHRREPPKDSHTLSTLGCPQYHPSKGHVWFQPNLAEMNLTSNSPEMCHIISPAKWWSTKNWDNNLDGQCELGNFSELSSHFTKLLEILETAPLPILRATVIFAATSLDAWAGGMFHNSHGKEAWSADAQCLVLWFTRLDNCLGCVKTRNHCSSHPSSVQPPTEGCGWLRRIMTIPNLGVIKFHNSLYKNPLAINYIIPYIKFLRVKPAQSNYLIPHSCHPRIKPW